MESQETVLMVVALLISVGNLLVSIGRNRVNKAEVDTRALEVAVKMAEKTPDLEQQLRDALARLHEAQTEAAALLNQVGDLNEVIRRQVEELEALRVANTQLQSLLDELRQALHALRTSSSADTPS
jgi:uncharacterized phage infection (PIP) family protein YhgE